MDFSFDIKWSIEYGGPFGFASPWHESWHGYDIYGDDFFLIALFH